MGKKQRAQKSTNPNPLSPYLSEEPENLPPPQPKMERREAMIPTSKQKEFFRTTNPNVDWTAAIQALSQTLGTATTASTPAAEHIPQTHINPQPTTEPTPSKEPLDLAPISMYKSPEEAEKVDKEGTGKEERGVEPDKTEVGNEGNKNAESEENRYEEGLGAEKADDRDVDELAEKQ